MKTLFFGGLSYAMTADDLRALVAPLCDVLHVRLPLAHDDRPRGIAFVDVEDGAADGIISALHGRTFKGRRLQVRIADRQRGEAMRPCR